MTYAGERFDFVLNADQPKALYWIRLRGLMDCDERFKSVHQEAILEYDGIEEELPSGSEPDYSQSNRTGLVSKNCFLGQFLKFQQNYLLYFFFH